MARFDYEMHGFWLVTCIMAWILLIAGEHVVYCQFWTATVCAEDGKLIDLATAVLASALAFVAGRSTKGE